MLNHSRLLFFIYTYKAITALTESHKFLLKTALFTNHIILPFKVSNLMAFDILTQMCIHRHNQFWNIFVSMKRTSQHLDITSKCSQNYSLQPLKITKYYLYRFYFFGHYIISDSLCLKLSFSRFIYEVA
jgi:hypothetical protein